MSRKTRIVVLAIPCVLVSGLSVTVPQPLANDMGTMPRARDAAVAAPPLPAPQTGRPGDFNGDGRVDGDDILPWVHGWVAAVGTSDKRYDFGYADANADVHCGVIDGHVSAADADCFLDALLN